jgi:DDE superfamily endonuclease
MWCVATIDKHYRTRLLDVVKIYERPYDARQPVVCFDEKMVELRADVRAVRRRRNGMLLRDAEYRRCGTANVFVMTEPRGGRHYVRVTKRRTATDFANALQFLAGRYRKATTIHLVMDNLNIHCAASLERTFGQIAGQRLWRRFTVHHTPKHGSWLNQAELAIGVMTTACLRRRRIPSLSQLRAAVSQFWAHKRATHWTIDWTWTSHHARSWLKHHGTRH